LPIGFATTESIKVHSSDVARVERAAREVTSLLEAGVSISSSEPLYFYTRLGELKLEMLAAAGRDARSRAENILKSTGGGSIGKLLGADMGIITSICELDADIGAGEQRYVVAGQGHHHDRARGLRAQLIDCRYGGFEIDARLRIDFVGERRAE